MAWQSGSPRKAVLSRHCCAAIGSQSLLNAETELLLPADCQLCDRMAKLSALQQISGRNGASQHPAKLQSQQRLSGNTALKQAIGGDAAMHF
mmetsp:Transcript_25318/g.47626  ORF Transcript_25318/g.47626 Transcript_25318/m.47626 type:complete len:92 (-) Transcript_25318:30-305(-)